MYDIERQKLKTQVRERLIDPQNDSRILQHNHLSSIPHPEFSNNAFQQPFIQNIHTVTARFKNEITNQQQPTLIT